MVRVSLAIERTSLNETSLSNSDLDNKAEFGMQNCAVSHLRICIP